jgi:hypothetical protein
MGDDVWQLQFEKPHPFAAAGHRPRAHKEQGSVTADFGRKN